MKAHREHRVPLSPGALHPGADADASPNQSARRIRGPKPGKPLSNMAFLMLLRRMGYDAITAHGFRATFKTWASERASF
jgi:integrase